MSRQERIKQRLFDKEYLTKQEWWGDDETILTSDESDYVAGWREKHWRFGMWQPICPLN